MGSWVRTITTPFRKMLNNPQREQQHGGKKASRHRRTSSGIVAAHGGDDLERTTSSQLYGEVMACTYEDVQVMWSMLDKARISSAAS